jgi:hypothetical protein
LVLLIASEVATTIGPRRPNSISKESINFPYSGNSADIPVESPTVPAAEMISNSSSSVLNLVVNLRKRSAPIITNE